MRETFIASLVEDVLGPRAGIREIMTESPLGEYITGVLSPVTRVTPRDIEASAELPTEEYVRETEETEGTDDAGDVAPFAPVLNPQSRPFSMGISFGVASDQELPTFDVCITWARYLRADEGAQARWARQPRSAVLLGRAAANSSVWLDAAGQQVAVGSPQAEVSLHVTARPLAQTSVLTTLHLVNRVSAPPDDRPNAEHHVYQPQIRIRCANGSRVVGG